MIKQLPRKLRYVLVGSLVLNAVLTLWLLAAWYIRSSGALDYAEIHAFNNKFCVQNYQSMLDKIDEQYSGNPARAADLKNSYAINVCLKNYKTGERLDVQPLIDQVK